MIVVLIVLVNAIVFNVILVTKTKVVIVLLATLVLVLVRTTIVCIELNIDTYHNNKHSYCSTTTIATINTNISNHGNNNGSLVGLVLILRCILKKLVIVVVLA